MEGQWLFSDRPPLETGFALLQWPLWGVHTQLGYQLLATGLQVSWLPALWTVLRVRGLGAGRVTTVVLMTAATGAVFFNTIYVWPKMLAGSLAVAALAILASRDRDDRWAGAGILAAALATLSMLAHGGTAFALIALAPFVYLERRRITARSVTVCAAAAAALYLPWTLFQHFVDPPGNRLTKWMLAGVIPVTREGVLGTIAHQYLSLSLPQLLANKWDNVAALMAAGAMWRTQTAAPAWTSGFLGLARLAQLYDVLPAAGLLLLGLLALLFPSGRRVLAPAWPLAVFTGLAAVVWVILIWGGSVKRDPLRGTLRGGHAGRRAVRAGGDRSALAASVRRRHGERRLVRPLLDPRPGVPPGQGQARRGRAARSRDAHGAPRPAGPGCAVRGRRPPGAAVRFDRRRDPAGQGIRGQRTDVTPSYAS